jgi:hypothetical protein
MNTAIFNEKYIELIENILPQFDLVKNDFEAMSELVNRLEEFYTENAHLLLEEISGDKNVSIFAELPDQVGWHERLKAQLLYAGKVVAADPIIHTMNDHVLYFDENLARGLSEGSLYTYFFDQIEKSVSIIYSLIPLLEENLLSFSPIYGFYPDKNNIDWCIDDIANEPGKTVRDILPHEIFSDYLYLIQNIEILEAYKTYPQSARIKLPLLDKEYQTVILRPKKCSIQNLEAKMGLSFRQWIALNWIKYYHFNLRVVKTSMFLSEQTEGIFWTPKLEYWNVMKHFHNSLNKQQKIYEFLDITQLPYMGNVNPSELIKIRNNEEAFMQFRRSLSEVMCLIEALPWDHKFEKEAEDVFQEYYRPSIEVIRKTVDKNRSLKSIPLILVTLGFAFSSTILSGSSLTPAVLTSLAAALGFSDKIASMLDPEKSVRSHPSYVLWKIESLNH